MSRHQARHSRDLHVAGQRPAAHRAPGLPMPGLPMPVLVTPGQAAPRQAAVGPMAQRLLAERPVSQYPMLHSGTAIPNQLVRHVRRNRQHRALRGLALTMAGIVAFGVAGASEAANRITGNLVSVDLDSLLTHDRPTAATAAEVAAATAVNTNSTPITGDGTSFGISNGGDDGVGARSDSASLLPADSAPAAIPLNPVQPAGLNILVMGTDDRSGENGALADRLSSGARSDSTILLHISGDRKWVAAVSIPRDTIVNIPACPTTSGKYIGAHPFTRFNAAFAYGAAAGKNVASGALCTLTTVEKITGIRLDGFITLDFAGFKSMVDALGGVEVDIPTKIHSPLAGDLRLDPGVQTLDGWQALQYARARTGVGFGGGSDLGRITRQQQLIKAIAHQVLATNLLTDSPQLLRFLDATTSSMTTSSNYASVNGLVDLASALSNIDVSDIQFLMAPVYTNPENPNTVLFSPKAKILWDNLRYDQPPEIEIS